MITIKNNISPKKYTQLLINNKNKLKEIKKENENKLKEIKK